MDYAISFTEGTNERMVTELEAQSDEVNDEQARQAVERKQMPEWVKTGLARLAFSIQVVGLWGDGA